MAPIPPSKNWMTTPLLSEEYLAGVASFIKFTKENAGSEDWYCCPCVKCRNVHGKKTLEVISEHLICDGIDASYKIWVNHGESLPTGRESSSTINTARNEDVLPRIEDIFNDTFRHVHLDDLDECLNESPDENDTPVPDDSPLDTDQKQLLEEAMKPLYPSCAGQHTKLSFTMELLSLKARHQLSDNCFTELLGLIKKVLPDENTLPDNTKVAKDMIKPFRMTYEIIHACPNDCILYWRENADRDKCHVCGESRWLPMDKSKRTAKKLPHKKLRYFPLTERFKRMYNVPWIAENMIWHANAKESIMYMRHPVDSSCWKQIDMRWPEFAAEKRNVRLGLATDGFNPFGMNNSYSCWPVIIVPYNLPPSLCMRKEFTMLTLLIPGPNGPGHDIDVYLQPLIAELNELWSVGSITYDSFAKNTFSMKAILLWAIHDFPAYGHLSGCKTAGRYGCPICSEGTDSMWLVHGKKFSYMGHRRFLTDSKHPFRIQKAQFNGKEEHGKAPRRLNGSQVLCKMEALHTTFGKANKKKKRERAPHHLSGAEVLCKMKAIHKTSRKVAGKKRKRYASTGTTPGTNTTAWSKRSILFDLPYWKDLPVRHNLDVMHVEKNIAENLFATIMDTKGKTKDGIEARRDLKDLKIRKNLWPVEKNGKISCPKAPFSLSKSEREIVCKTLHTLKVPIGYSGNWKHNVCLQDFQLKGLKSHDYHILLQGLLPIFLMHTFKKDKPLRGAIRQLSIFFNILCSKVINRAELSNMEKRIVETLCVFEKYFPPSFFVSMTHLVVHLAEEAKICGPVRYRWMYPFERMMKVYKRGGRNKTFLEGSISEQYLIEEAMRYCMEYIPDGRERSYKRGGRLFVDDDDNESPHPTSKNGKIYHLQNMQFEQVRKWILSHSPENTEWEEKYNEYLQGHKSMEKSQRRHQPARRVMDYIPWLREQLEQDEMSTIKRLANGPDFDAIAYNTYTINGYVFVTSDYEKNKTTQNSGVSMKALTSFRSSAKDKNLVEEEVTHYGILKQILELNYYDFKQTVFYCDWVCIEDRTNGYMVDPETHLVFVNLGRFKRNSSENDEPFILASQATQVFYCKDQTRDNWHLVLESPKKLNHNVDTFEDPLVFEPSMEVDALALSLIADCMEDDEEHI